MLNSGLKFHEAVLKGFKAIERSGFCHRTATYKVQRDITKNLHIQELRFLRSARRPMSINISMKFHEDILNEFVIERTRFCHRNSYL